MADQSADTLHDNSIGWAILLVIAAVLIWLMWYYFDAEIRNIVRWIRYGEMWLLHWVLPADYTVIYRNQEINWHEWFEKVPQWNYKELKRDHLALFGALTMQPLKLPFMGALGLGALWAVFYGPRTHNRKTLGLEGLIEFQAKNFPIIAPFVDFNPGDQPPRPPGSPVPAELPLFAEALGPEEWVAYNAVPCPDGKIDEKAAAKAFRKQLIGRWKGAKALAPHQKILLASFCLKAARKRGEADAMLGRLALCWSQKSGLQLRKDSKLLKEAMSILSNKELAGKTIKMANRHAFVTTALLGALQFAREEGGVLAPSQFVWLRGHERTLWYPLNNLGRESHHIEALGAMSHYKSECMTGRPIPVPKLEDAVTSITNYMASDKARAIPTLDYSNSKKRGIKKAK